VTDMTGVYNEVRRAFYQDLEDNQLEFLKVVVGPCESKPETCLHCEVTKNSVGVVKIGDRDWV